MQEIIFITGGQRSGKSHFAQTLAEQLSPRPVYLATSRHWDEDFTKRIERHQAERGSFWRTIEEEKRLDLLDFSDFPSSPSFPGFPDFAGFPDSPVLRHDSQGSLLPGDPYKESHSHSGGNVPKAPHGDLHGLSTSNAQTASHWDSHGKPRQDLHKEPHKNLHGEASRTPDKEYHAKPHENPHDILQGETVLLDCITLWLTNIFHDNAYNLERSLTEAQQIWDAFVKKPLTLIAVSNEVGMGLHAPDTGARHFADLQGWMNQYIAAQADSAYVVLSGIPLKLK